MKPEMEFFVEPSRCIGCQACYHACSECETHRGHSMIHIEYVDRSQSVQTFAMVCMHCHSPTCADVCPTQGTNMATKRHMQNQSLGGVCCSG